MHICSINYPKVKYVRPKTEKEKKIIVGTRAGLKQEIYTALASCTQKVAEPAIEVDQLVCLARAERD